VVTLIGVRHLVDAACPSGSPVRSPAHASSLLAAFGSPRRAGTSAMGVLVHVASPRPVHGTPTKGAAALAAFTRPDGAAGISGKVRKCGQVGEDCKD